MTEPYRENDNHHLDSNNYNKNIDINESEDDSSPSKMKPMSVASGQEYGVHYAINHRDSNRKAMLASFISVLFLGISWFLTDEYRTQITSGAAAAAASTRHNETFQALNCNDHYNTSYFAALMTRIQAASPNDLCNADLGLHSCKCHNPFVAAPQDSYPGWQDVVEMNVALLQQNYSSVQPEVVLYGDSITEHLLGRNFGVVTDRYASTAQVFESVLTKRGGGRINGLPMGVSGDNMAHLLYRLQNGEMPDTLHPKAWWILIGTNDLGLGCSVDTIVAGNLRIVQEIRERHHYQEGHTTVAPIVMNSILPRGGSALVAGNEHSGQADNENTNENDSNNNDTSKGGPQHILISSPWPSLQQVNQQLECYASITPGVYFANVTDTFSAVKNNGNVYISEDLFKGDYLHPNAKGYQAWLQILVQRVMELMG